MLCNKQPRGFLEPLCQFLQLHAHEKNIPFLGWTDSELCWICIGTKALHPLLEICVVKVTSTISLNAPKVKASQSNPILKDSHFLTDPIRKTVVLWGQCIYPILPHKTPQKVYFHNGKDWLKFNKTCEVKIHICYLVSAKEGGRAQTVICLHPRWR